MVYIISIIQVLPSRLVRLLCKATLPAVKNRKSILCLWFQNREHRIAETALCVDDSEAQTALMRLKWSSFELKYVRLALIRLGDCYTPITKK